MPTLMFMFRFSLTPRRRGTLETGVMSATKTSHSPILRFMVAASGGLPAEVTLEKAHALQLEAGVSQLGVGVLFERTFRENGLVKIVPDFLVEGLEVFGDKGLGGGEAVLEGILG